jgi:hypothetical protein
MAAAAQGNRRLKEHYTRDRVVDALPVQSGASACPRGAARDRKASSTLGCIGALLNRACQWNGGARKSHTLALCLLANLIQHIGDEVSQKIVDLQFRFGACEFNRLVNFAVAVLTVAKNVLEGDQFKQEDR